MTPSPKVEDVDDAAAAGTTSDASVGQDLDDPQDEQGRFLDFVISSLDRGSPTSSTASEADPDAPAGRNPPRTGVGHLLRHVRVSLLWLQEVGDALTESDLAGTVCQWLGRLNDPGEVTNGESMALDSLREVLRQVAARRSRSCVRCGEAFEEEYNAWNCKEFLDNHYNGKGRLEVYPLAPCWVHDAERAEKLMGMDFSLLNRELAETRPDGFRWNCCGKNALAVGCGMLKHVSS